jgi:hypothetical protein
VDIDDFKTFSFFSKISKFWGAARPHHLLGFGVKFETWRTVSARIASSKMGCIAVRCHVCSTMLYGAATYCTVRCGDVLNLNSPRHTVVHSAVPRSAAQCGAVRCGAVQCGAALRSAAR